MATMLQVSCDESGHTGPDLLNVDQRYFAYASVILTDNQSFEIIQRARASYRINMPELKASKLMQTSSGRSFVSAIVRAAHGQYAVNVHEKLLALCGWVFEYIYEPVYRDDPWLLYEKNLHRFISMFSWLWFNEAGSEAQQAVHEFQRYMRTRSEADAPLLFDKIHGPLRPDGVEHPFQLVLRFARGYRDLIIADNARLSTMTHDQGRWVLDLSASALWSHLNYWGRRRQPLLVRCDISKPLQAMVHHFTGDEEDPAIWRLRHMGHKEPLGWRLSEPVQFVDSRNHAAVQLADIIAGAVVACFSRRVPEGFEEAARQLEAHFMQDCILPDMDVIDLRQRVPTVNSIILYDLAVRAENKRDPYDNLAEMYHVAELAWVRGQFRQLADSYDRGLR